MPILINVEIKKAIIKCESISDKFFIGWINYILFFFLIIVDICWIGGK